MAGLFENDHIRPDTTTPGLKEAREKLVYYDMDPSERAAYDRHVDAIMIQNDVLGTAKFEGLVEGRAEGRAEGRTEGILEVARNMKRWEYPWKQLFEVRDCDPRRSNSYR